jgi:hypothetical protein
LFSTAFIRHTISRGYRRQRPLLDIAILWISDGSLSLWALGLVIEWAAQHRAELRANWEAARRHEPLSQIVRLE